MNNNINTNRPHRPIDKIIGCLSYLPNSGGIYITQYIYLKEPKNRITASIFIKETASETCMECEANLLQINAGIQAFNYYNAKPNEYDSILVNIENYLKTEGGIHVNEAGGFNIREIYRNDISGSKTNREMFWRFYLNQTKIKIIDQTRISF